MKKIASTLEFKLSTKGVRLIVSLHSRKCRVEKNKLAIPRLPNIVTNNMLKYLIIRNEFRIIKSINSKIVFRLPYGDSFLSILMNIESRGMDNINITIITAAISNDYPFKSVGYSNIFSQAFSIESHIDYAKSKQQSANIIYPKKSQLKVVTPKKPFKIVKKKPKPVYENTLYSYYLRNKKENRESA